MSKSYRVKIHTEKGITERVRTPEEMIPDGGDWVQFPARSRSGRIWATVFSDRVYVVSPNYNEITHRFETADLTHEQFIRVANEGWSQP